MRINGVLKST